MALVVSLKSIGTIQGMVEDLDGVLNTDSIEFNKEVFSQLIGQELKVLEFVSYSYGHAIKVERSGGRTLYLSHKWCEYIKNTVTDVKVKFVTEFEMMGDKYFKVGNASVIEKSTELIIKTSTLPICTSCGAMADVEVDGKKICSTCLKDKYAKLNNYSYKPTPNFIGEQLSQDTDTPYYYGIELEYGLTGKLDMSKLVFSHEKEVYLKSDSSIHGGDFRAELVTHPHSFKALMGNCFIDKLPTLKATEDRQHNGCHIHISRDAFIDDKHYAKWYFLMHEMKNINEFIGGRELTNYCSFTPEGKIGKKTKTYTGGRREVMINEANTTTVECRFFSSTVDPDEVRVFVQYLESLIKFTKYSDDVVTVEKWLEYTKRKSAKYAKLIAKIATYTGGIEGSVEFRLPKQFKETVKGITLNNLQDITEITLYNGKVYKDVSHVSVNRDGVGFHFDHNRDSTRIPLDKIKEVCWED